MSVNHGQIAELLAASRLAHQEYRDNVPRRMAANEQTVAMPGDVTLAGEALYRALRLRTEAHALDPGRVAPAWADEPVTHNHDELLGFYAEQLGR